MKRVLFMVVILLIVVSVTYGEDYTGTLKDAQYKIRVPENWNGILLMYSHGYGYIERYNQHQFDFSYADAAPGGEGMENFLLLQGYALAGTTFSGTGWQVKEGMHELVSLAGLFNGLIGKPKKIILIGYSMGGVIALNSAEEVPLYDGIIAGCTPASTSKLFDLTGAGALAYDAVFRPSGWPESWGKWYDVRDNLDFNVDVVKPIIGQFYTPDENGNFPNYPKFEFMRRLSHFPEDWLFLLPDGRTPGFFLYDMFFITAGRAELEARAKGPIIQNADHVYTLSGEDKEVLTYMGLDVESLLTYMNSKTTIVAGKPQRQYLEKYFDPSGDLQKPVITIHSAKDALIPEYFETLLAETVKAANKQDMLLQVFTADPGHCTFNPLQLLSTIKAMEFWLEYGTKPDNTFFPESFSLPPPAPPIPGFIPLGYTPGPWPIGKK